MSIDVERQGGDVTICLAGDLDAVTAGVVADLLRGDADGSDRTFVVDLAGVSSFEPAALAALLRVRSALDERAVPMRIRAAPASVLRLAPLAGLDGMCGQPPTTW